MGLQWGSNGGKWGKIIYASFGYFLGHCYGTLLQIIGLKATGNPSHQFWSDHFSILLGEGPKNHNGFGRVKIPQNQHDLSLETPGHPKRSKNNAGIL